MILGKLALIPAMSSSRPACAADEHEPELDQDREQHQQRRRDPRAVATGGDQPGGADRDGGAAEHDDRDAEEVEALRGTRDRARDRRPRPPPIAM